MALNKLWTKLFSRNEEKEEIALHSSGATVRHHNPFESLEVPRNGDELSQELIDKYVVPFYMSDLSPSDEPSIHHFAEAAREIDSSIVKMLLGDFNWRTRIVGAYFAAINAYKEFEDIIGKHLLKSEVCYAGKGYCIALATFNNEIAKEYLTTYLNYYLDRRDLWFDQAEAFCALEYLDEEYAMSFSDKWNAFVEDKKYWNLENSRGHFKNSMLGIEKIQKAIQKF
jgi:hypothetical protein